MLCRNGTQLNYIIQVKQVNINENINIVFKYQRFFSDDRAPAIYR